MAPESGKEDRSQGARHGRRRRRDARRRRLEGRDVWGTAYALAAAIRRTASTGAVRNAVDRREHRRDCPALWPSILGVPALTYVRKLDARRRRACTPSARPRSASARQRRPPALVSVTKSINEPRYPSLKGIMGAKKKTIARSDAGRLGSAGRSAPTAPRPNRRAGRPRRARQGPRRQGDRRRRGRKVIFDFLKEKKLV